MESKTPNPTAVYTMDIDGDVTFAWVLTPADRAVPPVSAKLPHSNRQQVKIQIEVVSEEPVTATVPLSENVSTLIE